MFDLAATSCCKTYFWTSPKIGVPIDFRLSAATTCCEADFWNGPKINVSIDVLSGAIEHCHKCLFGRVNKSVFQFAFDPRWAQVAVRRRQPLGTTKPGSCTAPWPGSPCRRNSGKLQKGIPTFVAQHLLEARQSDRRKHGRVTDGSNRRSAIWAHAPT